MTFSNIHCQMIAGGDRRIPHGWRVYAVGDIHGRLDLLQSVLLRINDDLRAYPCATHVRVFTGDLIDRGPDSRGVIDALIRCKAEFPTVCLAGNHEIYALRFLTMPQSVTAWFDLGGRETLRSYGIDVARNRTIPADLASGFREALGYHATFLSTLPSMFELGDFLFVHAGVRPGIPLVLQRTQDLTMIREPFLSFNGDLGRIVIHGHTPVGAPDIRSNRINIDTGAYATSNLTCIAIEGNFIRFI